MNNIACPSCNSRFYAVVSNKSLVCPFCGHGFRMVEVDKRRQKRAMIQRNCELLKEGVTVTAQTVDISKSGIGVRAMGVVPFNVNDTLNVVVKDFDINSRAKVVWIKRFDNVAARAGLRFC